MMIKVSANKGVCSYRCLEMGQNGEILKKNIISRSNKGPKQEQFKVFINSKKIVHYVFVGGLFYTINNSKH